MLDPDNGRGLVHVLAGEGRMGVVVEIQKVYHYPFQQVVSSYLTKYPTPLETHVTAIKTVEENTDPATGIVYRRRIATCNNVIPSILRRDRIQAERDHIDNWGRIPQLCSGNICSNLLETWGQKEYFNHGNDPAGAMRLSFLLAWNY